ncbi:hypothetical protein [Stenotrophomonas pictorum]|uniref:hypothetical protein n=1 Tax=Stenotrophomonas pictorum TaxID=86184 RepID=UPI0006D0E250|nr:hypothetical protein [Stenotrophomonas pictorum]
MVLYSLSELDARIINARRIGKAEQQDALIDERLTPGVQVHEGSCVAAGDGCPAVIVRVLDDGRVNLKVLLDGNDDHWVTCRCSSGADLIPGTWSWPKRR